MLQPTILPVSAAQLTNALLSLLLLRFLEDFGISFRPVVCHHFQSVASKYGIEGAACQIDAIAELVSK